MKNYNEWTVFEMTEDAYKSGLSIGIITGGVIFAVVFLIFSAIDTQNNVPCAEGWTRTITTCIKG